ncbi:UTP--glucose-1-phosphate uridylyltransferase AglF [Candidatus Tiddalikarchaeum anstoanum]|nr:UTP--glucose-1-phosphate uridylyltransferase AglF [Candidatus Tiddalikarchaeum anstoanum]
MIGIIPAAGSGTRMYPFTKANPKELFPIERRAVIDHVIESLHKYMGVDKILIIVGSHKGAIIDHVGSGGKDDSNDLSIAYLFQEERLGLAHAIYQAKNWISEDFIVHAGDSFIHPKDELKDAVNIQRKEKPFATILVTELEDPTHHGIVKVDNKNYLVDTFEKPTLEQAKSYKVGNKYLALTAIYIFSPEIFSYIEKTPKGVKDEYQITDSIKLALKDGKKIRVVKIKGEYIDIGNWESVEKANEFFRNLKKEEKDVKK